MEFFPIVFIIASIIVIITPGQDMILVMSRSISQGSKAGVATAAGVSVGLLGHTILATFGLGALLRASDVFFTIMKFLGAAYLFYLGIKIFLSRNAGLNTRELPATSLRKVFFQGALSNLSNPKIAIFYLRLSSAVRPVGGRIPDTPAFSAGRRVRRAHLCGERPGGIRRGHLVELAARPPRR